MPRCYNDSKAVSLVNSNHKHNTDDIVLTQSHAFSIGSQLEVDEDPPVIEKSHRRLRCDLSPVPTSTNSNFNIKLLGLKVRFQESMPRFTYFLYHIICSILFEWNYMRMKYCIGIYSMISFLALFPRVTKVVVRIIRWALNLGGTEKKIGRLKREQL